MQSMNDLLLAAGFVPFAAFSWAVKGHFRSSVGIPVGMTLISALSLAAFLWFGYRLLTNAADAAWPLAVLLFALALAIFAWAVVATRRGPPSLAFDPDQPTLLYRHGPYRYVRHPFYLAYLAFWIGTAVASPGLLGWTVPLVMLTIYAYAARREELKFASSALAGPYADYKRQVGMFLPRPWALPH